MYQHRKRLEKRQRVFRSRCIPCNRVFTKPAKQSLIQKDTQMNSTKMNMTDEYNASFILENLPHGSGIDLKWIMDETQKTWKFRNAFHLMNEHGMYYSWADFTLHVPKRGKWSEDFRLTFADDYARRQAKKNNLREYLEDLFTWTLQDVERYIPTTE